MNLLTRKQFAWITYDWANTVFSMNVVSLTFGPWMTKDLGVADIWVSCAYSISMAAVALTAPALGVLADRRGMKYHFFAGCTLISIIACALISGTHHIPGFWTMVATALLLYAIANYGYQSALVFYNSYLPELAEPSRQGKLSGYGTAAGYVGAIAGLLLIRLTSAGSLPSDPSVVPDRMPVFWISAVAFLVFAIPSFIMLRPEHARVIRSGVVPLKEVYGQIVTTFKEIRSYPGVLRFLLAKFFYEDAISTAVVFMAVYTEKVLEFPPKTVIEFFLVCTAFAGVGAFVSGFAVDRTGPKNVLMVTLAGWVAALIVLISIHDRTMYYITGCGIGVVLGSTWTAARPLFIRLIPSDRMNEFFGLYALSGKAAAITGPMVWGLIVLLLSSYGNHVRYRGAVSGLMLMIVAGAVLLSRVSVPAQTGLAGIDASGSEGADHECKNGIGQAG